MTYETMTLDELVASLRRYAEFHDLRAFRLRRGGVVAGRHEFTVEGRQA